MVGLSEFSVCWSSEGLASVNITGEWLQNFGFYLGTRVVIEVVKNQIVVKAVADGI